MNEGGSKDWEEVGPSSSSSHPHSSQRDWEVLDDYDCSIFPPSSHEGLLLLPSQAEAPPPPPPPPLPTSAVDRENEEEHPLRRQSLLNSRFLEFTRCRLELGLQLFCSKLLLFLRCRAFPSAAALPSAAAAALVGVLFLVRRWRRRRQALGTENDSLLRLVREHDEKIAQLMHQVAEMNKVLSASRRVPFLRIA